MRELTTKLKNNDNHFYILSFIIPFVILNALYIVFKFFPFGDNQILVIDAYHQYYQFLVELRGKLLGGESLLYSWHMGMGTDFLSLMAYYCASPLNLLSILVPIKFLSYFFGVLISLKISFASLFCAIYLKNIYNKKEISIVFFSLLYSFCGFIAGYYWNIMWIDVFALLPLVILGLKKAIEKNKYLLYILSLALCFLTNYYMSIFICIFIVIFYFAYSIIAKVKFIDFVKKGFIILGSSILAAGLMAWILIPAATALTKVYQTAGAFQGKIETYNSFIDIFSNLLAFNYPTVREGLPNIYSGLIAMFLVIVYFFAKNIKLRNKIISFIVIVFMILSTNINLLNYIWHGFRYTNMLPYRFTFIFTFIIIELSYVGFKNIKTLSNKEFIMIGIPSLILVVSLSMNRELAVIIANTILFMVYLGILFIIKNNNKSIYKIILLFLIIAELIANMFIGMSTAGKTTFSQFNSKKDGISEFVDEVEKKEKNNFYRMEIVDRFTFNDPALYQYNGVSLFSSTIDARVSTFLEKLGVPSYPIGNRYFYNYGTPVINSILDVKYLISKDKALNDEFSMKPIEEKDGMYLYRNNKTLPLGFMVDEKSLDETYSYGLIENQNQLLKKFTDTKESIFRFKDMDSIDSDGIELYNSQNGNYDYSLLDEKVNGRLNVKYIIPETGYYYLESDKSELETVSVKLNESINNYDIRRKSVMAIGHYLAGDEITISVELNNKDDGNYYCNLAKLNEDTFNSVYEKLSQETLKVEEYNSTKTEGNIEVTKDGYLFTSIPYNEGWKVYVDGEKQDIVPYNDAFVGVFLKSGDHKLEFKYKSPGFMIGLGISSVSIFILTSITYCKKKRNNKSLIVNKK